MRALYVATMSTEHFTWTAAGGTDAAARLALLTAFNRSAVRHPYPDVVALEDAYGINVLVLAPGAAYRDDSLIVRGDLTLAETRRANR